MIYRYEGFYDPLRICLIVGYVEAVDINDALAQANALMLQKGQMAVANTEHCIVAKLEETNIKISKPARQMAATEDVR
jgi:hypothetical protein